MLKEKKYRILVIDPTQGTGGATKSLLSTAKFLDKSIFKIFMLVHRDGPFLPMFKEHGVSLVHNRLQLMRAVMFDPNYGLQLQSRYVAKIVKFFGLLTKQSFIFYALLSDYWTILRIVRQKKIHLIHFNAYGDRFLPISWICKFLNVPVLYHVRGKVRPVSSVCLFTKYAFFVYVSEFVKNYFLSTGARTKGNFVVYNGRDPEEFSNVNLNSLIEGSLKKQLSIPENHKLVVNISTLTRGKGQHTFIKAANIVAQKERKISFLIIGDNVPYEEDIRAELVELISSYSLTNRILVIGQRTDIAEILSQAYLSVVSTELEEALCGVNIEAMAVGVPVITTDTGSINEVVIHNETGLIVPPGDHEAMAEAILQLLGNKRKAQKMGVAGFARFCEKFNAREQASALAMVYNNLLSIPQFPEGAEMQK